MVIILGLVCLLATAVGAISGIGGGVIIKPVMDAVSGLPVSEISFLSGCTVLSMSVVSLLSSFRDSSTRLEPKRGTLLAVGAAVGGIAGKQVFESILRAVGSSALVGIVQNVLMVLLTLGVLVYVQNKSRIHSMSVQNSAACVGIGLALGMMSAFLGIGGGPINLAVLYYFFSMNTKTAALHSIYVILFSQITSLATTVVSGKIPPFDPVMLIVMALCGVLGGLAGRSLNRKMSAAQVDKLFLVLLVVITGISVYNLFHYVSLL